MAAGKKPLSKAALDYLKKAGVDDSKLNRPAPDVSNFRRTSGAPKWQGSDYRPDLFRYSIAENPRHFAHLERKGYFQIDMNEMDLQYTGNLANDKARVFACPIEIAEKWSAERHRRDAERKSKKVRKRATHSGALLESSRNKSSARAHGEGEHF